jgi:hypothetical protein
MTTDNDYPYLRAWCRLMGSYKYYIEDQLDLARSGRAPQTAIYMMANGTWQTIEKVTNPHTRQQFISIGLMTPDWTVPS